MNLDDLKKPFPPEIISWRVGATNRDKTKAIALAYIDARDVMDRLDQVCGVGNWQCKHPHANGKTSCAIGIKINDEWVWKENGAGDSQVEAEKGAFSDSLKRAAVMWGIGRYLYDVANVWVDIEEYGRSYKIKNANDPLLKKALQDAEKGIRPSAEQEEKRQKLTDLKTQLKTLKTYEEVIEFSRSKETMALVKDMSEEQAEWWNKELVAAQSRTSESPVGVQ